MPLISLGNILLTHLCAESETSGALAAGEEGAAPEAHSRRGEKALLSCRAWIPCPGLCLGSSSHPVPAQLQRQCKLPGSHYPGGSSTERNQWEMLVRATRWKRRKETIPLALEKPETENNQREISQRALPPQTHLFTTSLYPGACFSDTGFRNGLLNLQGQGQRVFSPAPAPKTALGHGAGLVFPCWP